MIGQTESTFSREIADATRRDSISMKTLAMLGATFLPGTFLSSLFSMSFFNFDDGELPRAKHKQDAGRKLTW